MTTISEAILRYLDNVKLSRSKNTAKTYGNALVSFELSLEEKSIVTEETAVDKLDEDSISWFANYLKDYAPTTERLYLTAVKGFFEYLVAERLAPINLPRINLLLRQRSRRPGQRLPQFPKSSIEKVIKYAINLDNFKASDHRERLRNMRDRAFIVTLADTGLRVHEACALRRGDIDWNEGKAVIIGKGDRQAIIRFSSRSIECIKDYIRERSKLDGNSGRPLSSLAVFSRHDRGVGRKLEAITTTTGRNIINQRVVESLGENGVGTITPHSFRHFFVTTVLQASGNLKLAQELARHKNIQVTQRYAHLTDDELDKGYWEVFENEVSNG